MRNPPLAPALVTDQPDPLRVRRAARCGVLTLLGIVLYVALDVVAQLLPPHYSPISQAESNLAVGPFGWIMTINFVIRGLLSLCFLLGLYAALTPRARSYGGFVLLAVWTGGAFVLAAFRTDVGPRQTLHGLVHLLVALVAFFAAAVGAVLLSLRLAHDPRWASLRPLLLTIALASVLVLVGNLLASGAAIRPADGGVFGLVERVFLGLILLWMLVASIRLVQLGRARA